jgi:hypothetical protein
MADSKMNVLILTATITPPTGAIKLARTDPKLRMSDYRKALSFYLPSLLDGTISSLIFADNSDSDMSELETLCATHGVSQKTEFISTHGLEDPPAYGRGFGEFKMLDDVMKNSRTIRELPSQANIWKLTGRYIIRNLEEVMRTRPPDADIYCHCRNIPMRWIDLYVLCWNRDSYDEVLKNIFHSLREDTGNGSAEQAFRKIIDEQTFNAKIVKRFRTLPKLEGTRGVDNQRYQEMSLKYSLRKSANYLAPWLWI